MWLVIHFATYLVDTVLALITFGYAAALVATGLGGYETLSWAPLRHGQILKMGLWATVVTLVLSGVTDSIVAVDFLTTGGAHTKTIAAGASLAGVALLALGLVCFLRSGRRKQSAESTAEDQAACRTTERRTGSQPTIPRSRPHARAPRKAPECPSKGNIPGRKPEHWAECIAVRQQQTDRRGMQHAGGGREFSDQRNARSRIFHQIKFQSGVPARNGAITVNVADFGTAQDRLIVPEVECLAVDVRQARAKQLRAIPQQLPGVCRSLQPGRER